MIVYDPELQIAWLGFKRSIRDFYCHKVIWLIEKILFVGRWLEEKLK